jgi:hypothetical protein
VPVSKILNPRQKDNKVGYEPIISQLKILYMNDKNILSYIFLLSLIAAVACSGNDSTIVEKESATNKKLSPPAIRTAGHMKVPGSNLFIVPPAGFETNTTTYQLVKNDDKYIYSANFIIMFGTINLADYFASIKKDSEAKFPGVWKEEALDLGGHNAKICRFQAQEGIKGCQIYFTDGSSEKMIIGFYDEKDAITGDEMYEALKTVVIEE